MEHRAAGHRITTWLDERQQVWQVSVACLDETCEAVVEVTEAVGPFDDVAEVLSRAEAVAHSLGGWRAHQQTLSI